VSEQCLTSPPTQYRLYGRRFLQVKRPNQQYQSTEKESTKENNTKKHKENRKYTHTQNSIQITVTQTNTVTHRLATIHNVTDDRQTDATL